MWHNKSDWMEHVLRWISGHRNWADWNVQNREKRKDKKKVGSVRYDWIKAWGKLGPPQSSCMTHGIASVTEKS